jgi:lipopolysaccharide export system permease protein
VLIVFGLLNRHNEITVLTASGVIIYTLIKPVVAIGFFFSLFVLVVSELAIPLTAPRLNRLWYEEVKGKPLAALRQKNIWIRGRGSILHIKHYDPRHLSVHGISVNYLDGDFNLVRRVDALKGTFEKDRWTLSAAMEQVRDPDRGGYRIFFHEKKEEAIGLLPQDLEEMVKKSEEMSLLELSDYVDEIEREGYDATVHRVDLYAKTALPPVCIILSIMAAGIGVRRKTHENLAVSIGTGLFGVFIYWVLYSFSISLGYGGMMPPVLAAWLPNFIFLCFGAVVLLHVE